jgi:RNA polymerase sigma-70 factor (ECF subfamily)
MIVMKTDFRKNPDNFQDYPYELIEGCRRGDQRSQLQVYKLYYRPVFHICMNIVNDPATAENLMHESFLQAFENIGSYSGDISFSAWIRNFINIVLINGNNR